MTKTDPDVAEPSPLPIGAVERETGLSKDTLRIWERRYGFPVPERTGHGERVYPLDQVLRLRLIKRLMDAGMRPGKIMALDLAGLAALDPQHAAVGSDNDAVVQGMALLSAMAIQPLKAHLDESLMRLGLRRFVVEVLAPMNQRVGEAWSTGEIAVFQEHLYTEIVHALLHARITQLQASARPPRVLLTTLPREPHGIGLLMVQSLLAIAGCSTLSLGVQTPLSELVAAVKAHDSDVVALSFSSLMNQANTLTSLIELRRSLPASVAIWVGGRCPIVHRRTPEGVMSFEELDAIESAVAHWRAVHESRPA